PCAGAQGSRADRSGREVSRLRGSLMIETDFTLPPLQEGLPHRPDIKPAKVKVWLEELPRVPVGDTARSIADALAALNRVRVAASLRLQVMELYNDAADRLWSPLRREFTNQSQPLSQ